MKRIITVSFIALLAISFSGFAQDFSTNPNREVQPFGQIQYAPIDAITITHSVDPVTVTVGTGVACSAGGITSDNQYWRSFVLADFGITDDYAVTMVEFGIEDALAGIGGSQPMTVNLYTTDLVFPTGTLTLIGTLDVMVPDQALTLFQIPVTGTAPAGSELVVEVSIPADTGDGNRFFPGANSLGETADSWISSAGCGILAPVTYTSIGFPTCQLVMSVTGDVGSGAGGLLLIDDDATAADSVEVWLTALGETYTRMTAAAALLLPTSDWLMYDAVLYHGTTSVGAQLDSCTAYVAGGGNLLVMDNDEGFFFNATPLWLDYLMADYVSDAGSDGVLTGLDMMGGIDPDISADPFPDDCLPNTGAFGTGVPIFRAPGDTTYAGMRGDGGFFRTALLLWDADYTPSDLAPVIFARVINWLVNAVVPVELTSFTASVDQQDVTLNWVTATEINNQGFEVERNAGYGFEKIGFVAGFGTSSEIHTYAFVDASLNEGTYSYRLKQVDLDGSFEYSDVVEVDITVPDVFLLEQNYPNPFNPSTKINFSLAVNSKVTLKVFDILGQEVANLINTDLVAGSHSVDFNASLLTSGVYIYRMDATGINGTNFTNVKKMILTK